MHLFARSLGDLGMSSEWESGKLGDFIELKRGYDLPQAKRVAGAVPLLSSSGLSDYHNVAMVKGPGVVTGRYGTIGQVYYVEDDFWPLNTTLYVKDFKGNHPKFIHYFLKTVDFFAYSDKAAVPGVNRNHLHEARCVVPPLSEQIEIAAALGVFDDRIALLRETNATLEAIAQALFNSWFVDFDPVHAKQQGRAPEGMDEATAALFPDSFEESEVGVVPKGWRVGSIGNLASVRGGFAYKSSDFSDEGLPVLKIKNIVGDGTVDANDVQRISPAMAEKTTRFGLKDGDVLMAMTGATIGKVGIVVTLNNEVPYLNQRVAKFEEGKETGNNSWLIFTAFQNAFMSDQIVNAASGSAQPNISTTGIESARLIVPNNIMVLKAFDSIVAPLFLLWVNNQKQEKILAALRDTLLPRLISGQLRIPEAEVTIEEVTA